MEITDPSIQRKFICNRMPELTYEGLVELFDLVNNLVKKELINVHGTGSSLNLDIVSDDIVSEIYDAVSDLR